MNNRIMPNDFRNYIEQANIPEDCKGFFLNDLDCQREEQSKLRDKLKGLMEKEYRTLLIGGKQGTGKTFMACACLQEFLKTKYYETGKSCESIIRYTTHYEIDLEYKSCMSPKASLNQMDVYQKYSTYALLCIDEIGRGQNTDYTMSFLENIISKRYANKLPTILITNKTGAELKKLIDSPILDRIGNNKEGQTFNMSGDSLR